MKRALIVFSAMASMAVPALMTSPADARGGLNASYARAYCEFYRTKIAVAARYGSSATSHYESTSTLRSADSAITAQRGTPEYWRQMYRQCLKEHGY